MCKRSERTLAIEPDRPWSGTPRASDAGVDLERHGDVVCMKRPKGWEHLKGIARDREEWKALTEAQCSARKEKEK